jgi:hypothetical protein
MRETLFGKHTGDVLGWFNYQTGALEDIMGRTAQVRDYDEALDKMREWSWDI